MVSSIHIKMLNKKVEIDLSDPVLTQSTIKNIFYLHLDAIVTLCYNVNGKKKYCKTQIISEPCFILPKNWQSMLFIAESNVKPLQPSTFDNIKELSPKKRQKLDPEFKALPIDGDLIFQISQYAWYYINENNMKNSAIPITKKLAITFRHGENKKLIKGDIIKLQSYQKQNIVATRVVFMNNVLDFILLESDTADLCDRDLIMEAVKPRRGMKYVLMGYSVRYENTNHISFSSGIISSDITPRLRYLGSSGSFKGDSGGSCWNEDGVLIGMQVETEKILHTKDNHGRPASPATGERCGIIPLNKIHACITEFLLSEDDFDHDE